MRRIMRAETGSLGVRTLRIDRWAAERSEDQVEVAGMAIRIKVSPGRAKAEHRDAARVAARTGMPLREVTSIAEAAWRNRQTEPQDT
jgi:hypothetical protein